MPKWVWYVAAGFAVYYFFLRGKVTGGANLGVATGNNATGFTGYGAGGYPPGVNATTAPGYGVPLSVGNPGGTSGAQDAGAIIGGIGQLAGGLFGSGGLGGFINGLGGGGSSDTSGSYGDATYGNDPVQW